MAKTPTDVSFHLRSVGLDESRQLERPPITFIEEERDVEIGERPMMRARMLTRASASLGVTCPISGGGLSRSKPSGKLDDASVIVGRQRCAEHYATSAAIVLDYTDDTCTAPY